MKLLDKEGREISGWSVGRFTGIYKIPCPECGMTYKEKIPDLEGKVNCPECGYPLQYKLF